MIPAVMKSAALNAGVLRVVFGEREKDRHGR